MTTAAAISPKSAVHTEFVGIARSLGASFAERAKAADDRDAFVAENYRDLRQSGLVEAGVPSDLGGGGAEIAELCEVIKELAHHCGSTALAFSMHTHQVAIPAWRWTHQKAAPVVPILKRVAADRIILLSSGGSDWIEGAGKAEKVDGGYRITARKIFTSGSPIGDVLMTGAVVDEPDGAKVIHFGLPMKSPNVKVLDTWKAVGMRGTGSNDVMVEGHVVPDEAVALKRNQGEWHMLFHIISMIAFPLIYSAYLGVAESARDIALKMAEKKKSDPHVISLAGQMETELRAGQYAHAAMIAVAERGEPGPATTNEIMIGRTLVARHAIAAVELAMETVGGAAFHRDNGLERRFRDIQGARYHPMRIGVQQEFAGRTALGLDTAKTF